MGVTVLPGRGAPPRFPFKAPAPTCPDARLLPCAQDLGLRGAGGGGLSPQAVPTRPVPSRAVGAAPRAAGTDHTT